VISYLNNEMTFESLKDRLGIAICQFAKRQMTFFRKMEKDGVKINWLNADEPFETIKLDAIKLVHSKLALK
ncbi:MAG: tRNA (adenosine(37)-N6)-dimethylallyltransferase MiaA, partial [Pedobacter sp.]